MSEPGAFDAVEDMQERIADGRISNPDQICRCCIWATNRTQQSSIDFLKTLQSGKAVTEVVPKCSPDTTAAVWKLDSGSIMNKINPDGSIAVTLGRKWNNNPTHPVEVITNCGQHLQDKCRKCGHFQPQIRRVPGGSNASGRPWYREVVVGGSCRLLSHCKPTPLPRDSTKNDSCSTCANLVYFTNDWQADHGEVVYNDLLPYERYMATRDITDGTAGLKVWLERQHIGQRRRNNGGWQNVGTLHTFIGTNVGFDDANPEPPRREIKRFYWAVEGTKRVRKYRIICRPTSVRLVFSTPAGNIIRVFSLLNDDYRQGVVDYDPDSAKLPVTFLTPYNEDIGLYAPETRIPYGPVAFAPCNCLVDTSWWSTNPVMGEVAHGFVSVHKTPPPNPKCASCGGSGLVYRLPDTRPQPYFGKFGPSPICPRCTDTKPCYYHAKGFAPELDDDGMRVAGLSIADVVQRTLNSDVIAGMTEKVGQKRQQQRSKLLGYFKRYNPESNPARRLIVDLDGNVTDASRQAPDTVLLALMRDDLFRRYPAQRRQIWAQLAKAKRAWTRNSRAVPINTSFAKPMTVQPWAPYCSANLANPSIGIDMREALGDRWGEPRSNQGTNPSIRYSMDNHFSWTKYLALEEYLRATSTGERLSEHMATSQRHALQMSIIHSKRIAENAGDQQAPNWDEFEESKVIKYDFFGREEGHPEFDDDTTRYMEWLDTAVDVTLADGEDGFTFTASQRWIRYGYENFRSGKTLRGADLDPARENAELSRMRPAEEDESVASEVKDIYVGYICASCGTEVDTPEAIDADFICTTPSRDGKSRCGQRLVWFEGRGEDVITQMGAAQIESDELYKPKLRQIQGEMVVPPDRAAWQQTQMLMDLGHNCSSWRPRGPRGWSWPKPARSAEIDFAGWIGAKVTVYMGGGYHSAELTHAYHDNGHWRECPVCVHTITITDKNIEENLHQAIVRSGGRKTVTFENRYGNLVIASVMKIEKPNSSANPT